MIRPRSSWLLALVLLVAPPLPARGQSFEDWLNDRIDHVVAARLNQRSSVAQTEAPAIAGGSTSIVDGAGFSDLVGAALNPIGNGTAGSTDSRAVTITPYALLAGILARNPDGAFSYEQNKAWRRVALTLGTENPDDTDQSEQVVLLGAKVKLWTDRNVEASSQAVHDLTTNLGLAATVYGNLSAALQDSLFAWIGTNVGATRVQFINRMDQASTREAYFQLAGTAHVAQLEALIEADVDAFLALRRTSAAVLEELRGKPVLSLNLQSKLRPGGGDDVRLGLSFDVGLGARVQWVANASATFVTATDTSAVASGFTGATGLTIALGPVRLQGADPASLDIAIEGEFLERADATWRVQGKLTIPIAEGVDFPISATWASRTDLIDEAKVHGAVGFTVDTARLLAAIR